MKSIFVYVTVFIGALGCSTSQPATSTTHTNQSASSETFISMSAKHTCALERGRLWCWGLNSSGQLGDGTLSSRETPAEVLRGGGLIQQAVVGDSHSCALSNGGVWCWGSNVSGQLGDGMFVARANPALVKGMSRGVTFIDADKSETCAVQSGEVFCWGNMSSTPRKVDGIRNATKLSVNSTLSCALLEDNTISCWDRSLHARAVKTSGKFDAVESIHRNVGVLGGDQHAIPTHGTPSGRLCLVSTTKTLQCGHLIDTEDEYELILNVILDSGVESLDDHCYIRHGSVHCELYEPPAWVNELDPDRIQSIQVSELKRCIAGNGEISCWGQAESELALEHNSAYTFRELGRGITDVSIDSDGVCVVQNGAVVCSSGSGFRAIKGLGENVTRVSGTERGGCALANGALKCWGRNDYGQLGLGSISTDDSYAGKAIAVPNLESGVVDFEHVGTHVCALHEDAVKCWGYNYRQELILGCKEDRCPAPTIIAGLNNSVTQLAVSRSHSCVVHNTDVKCWGEIPERFRSRLVKDKQGFVSLHKDIRSAGQLLVDAYDACWVEGTKSLRDADIVQCWGDPVLLKSRVLGQAPSATWALQDSLTVPRAQLGDRMCVLEKRGLVCSRYGTSGDKPRDDKNLITLRGFDGASKFVSTRNEICGIVDGSLRCVWGNESFLEPLVNTRQRTLLPR